MGFDSLRAKLVIYRPPYSQALPITARVFFEGFASYLKSIIVLSAESLILTGDFNFHVDAADDPEARVFLDILTSMGLKQHVTISTHIRNHTLHLVITCEHDPSLQIL